MKTFILVLAFICAAASIAMYIIGDRSSHLSELKDFFYIPIPLALILFAIYNAKFKK